MGVRQDVRNLMTAEQRNKLVACVRAGKKWAEVAEECGFSDASHAARAFRSVLKAEQDALSDAVLSLREVEGERLDGVYQAAVQTLPTCATASEVNQCLKTMLHAVEARARLLGLNEEPAQKIEVTVTGVDMDRV
jgi:hypothetical protein